MEKTENKKIIIFKIVIDSKLKKYTENLKY